MDSSFLTGLHLVLSFCSLFVFLKQLKVFGISNQGLKIMSHLSSGSLMAYFVLTSLFDFEVINAWDWHRFHVIPLTIWSSSLLLQLVMMMGGENYQLHKTLTRIPILLSLVVMAWGGQWVYPIGLALWSAAFVLLFFMRGQRQQRRTLIKMYLFLFISVIVNFWSLAIGELILLAVIYYFSIFQNNVCVQNFLKEAKE